MARHLNQILSFYTSRVKPFPPISYIYEPKLVNINENSSVQQLIVERYNFIPEGKLRFYLNKLFIYT